MSNEKDLSYIIKFVVLDKQFAAILTAQGSEVPDRSQLVMLTAQVVINDPGGEDDGKPAPEGTKVFWSADPSTNAFTFYREKDGEVWIVTDKNDQFYPSPSPDTIWTLTDSLGMTSVFAGGEYMLIGIVYAKLTSKDEVNPEQLSKEQSSGGPPYQYIAVATFDENGTLKIPTGFQLDTDSDHVHLTDLDGTENPPRQTGTISNDSPWSTDGNEPQKGARLMFWGLSGADTTGVGQIAGEVISYWDGKPLAGVYPYSTFVDVSNTLGYSGTNNQVAYMFFQGGSALYSKILHFDFDGVPLVRPDDVVPIYDSNLPAVKYVETRLDVNNRHTVSPMPEIITASANFDTGGNITFAIPAPPDFDPEKNKDDFFDIGLYWNGWATGTTDMQTWPYKITKKGSDLKNKYTDDDDAYFLPFSLPKAFCLGFGPKPGEGWLGYFWAAYSYNRTRIAQPVMARLNLPGKRTPPPDHFYSGM